MKILFLTKHLNFGGITSYVLNLSRGLKRSGVSVVVASSGGALMSDIAKDGVSHVVVDMDTKSEISIKIPPAIMKVKEIVNRQAVDMIHANTRVTQIIGSIVSRLTGTPMVSTCHGFFRPHISRRLFGFWGDAVIAISEQTREHLIKDLGVAGKRVYLVHNCLDLDRFSKAYTCEEKKSIRRAIGLKDGPVVGMISRLSQVKGHKYFFEAMARTISRNKDVQLLVVGDGPEEKALRSLCKKLGLEEKTIFMGSVTDTHRILSVTDIYALPSLQEGLGYGLMEAMAAGTACVATDVGGIPDLISDGVTGLLAKAADAESLDRAISRLLKDASLRSNLGRSARDLIREKFDFRLMADKTQAVYKQVLASRQKT